MANQMPPPPPAHPIRIKRTTLVFGLVIVLLASIAAAASANLLYGWLHPVNVQPSASARPPLFIEPSELDLGRVAETTSHHHHFSITNTVDEPVTIRRFDTTCDCLGISPEGDVTLQPRETKQFDLKVKLLARGGVLGPFGDKPFQIRLSSVYAVDGKRPETTQWDLIGAVVPTIRIKPSVLYLGCLSDRQAVIEQSVAVEAASHVQSIDWTAPPDWAISIVREPTTAPSNDFRVLVRSRSKLIPRQISDVVRLTPVGSDGERLPDKEVKILGEIVRDVVSFPPAIQYGRQPCGTCGAEAIQLRSLTNRRFQVISIMPKTRDLDVARQEKPGKDGVYLLRLQFKKPGEQDTEAEFVIQDEDRMEYRIVVPVRYHGTLEQ